MNKAIPNTPDDSFLRWAMRPNTFGEFLRKTRIARYMPRSRLASLTGLLEKAVADFERNLAVPSAADIRKLAPALGLSEREMLIRAGSMNPERTPESAEHEIEGLE